MSRHASADHLASYAEGGLKPRKAAKIASHLAGCAVCDEQIQGLQQVSSLLASVQFPPIPDYLSSRIEMAIASEATARATSEQVSGEASRRDLPARGRPSRRRGWRVPGFSSPLAGSLAAVGAAVIIAGGGYEIASNVTAGGGETAGSSAVSHVPAAAPSARNNTPLSAHGTAGLQFGPNVQFQHQGHTDHVQAVHTGTNFVAAQLADQAQTAFRDARLANLMAGKSDLTSPYAAPQYSGASGSQLQGCVDRIAAGRDVLLVDLAKYQLKPATIIIAGTAPHGPAVVYVAGQGCSVSTSDILAQRNLPKLP